ncbi:uncharacterized protein VP01_657g5 [Puccinia sorghi]|uniref:Uncharacterized protein n=1 Tax=Puccinia sorghi TaxID=27349 RepID=A0A0L6UG49_9BASI|nr:uncharacterized protein VP01_657g5 [Puccinia sorghi]
MSSFVLNQNGEIILSLSAMCMKLGGTNGYANLMSPVIRCLLIGPGAGSTKNLHGHLSQINSLANPNFTKKTKFNHMDLAKWSQSYEMHPMVSLFILFRLLNESAMPLVESITKKSVATHSHETFLPNQETIKKENLSKHPFLSFTQNTWIVPNFIAMMAITAHYIERFHDERFPSHCSTHSGSFQALVPSGSSILKVPEHPASGTLQPAKVALYALYKLSQ